MTARDDLGAFGERLATYRLEADGLTVVARNVRLPSGEVDIIARDATDLVFIEVRTRRGPSRGLPAESISQAKLARMWRCAMEYCEAAGEDPETARLEVVAVDLDAGGRVAGIDRLSGFELAEGT